MRSTCFALASFLLAGAYAQASNAAFDFTTLGTSTTSQLSLPPLTVTADDGVNPATVNILNLNGLGVVGGFASNTLDGGEALLFSFTGAPAVGVRYAVSSTGNLNGNGTAGDAFVEAFDGSGASLGVIAVSGSGTKDLTVLFGGTPISAFRVRANTDTQRINSLSYNNPIAATLSDFTSLGTFTTATLVSPDVTVSADDGTNPATVNVLNLNGVGVVGGASSAAADTSEALLFDFGGVRTQISYQVGSAGNLNGNGTAGDAFVEAFDENGASLGVAPTSGGGTHSLASIYGNMQITKFRVRANGDSQVIQSVTSTPFIGPIANLKALPTSSTNRLATGVLVGHAMNGGLSAELGIGNGVGLGVVGGFSGTAIDGSEEATFFVDGSAAGAIDFTVSTAGDMNGNGIPGNAIVEAFDGNGASQGSVAISFFGVKDVAALFPGPLFSGFKVRASGDNITLSRIHVTPQPGRFAFPFYGTGCPGTGGAIPTARVTALTRNSGSDVTLTLANGLGGAPAFLFIGFQRADLLIGFGCRLYMQLPVIGPLGPLTLSPAGGASVTATLPAVPALVSVMVQAIIADGGVPQMFSVSNGVEMILVP